MIICTCFAGSVPNTMNVGGTLSKMTIAMKMPVDGLQLQRLLIKIALQ